MTSMSPNRTHILRALGMDDIEALLRWFVASRNVDWHPPMWWPKRTGELEEKCQRILPQLDAYHERQAAPK